MTVRDDRRRSSTRALAEDAPWGDITVEAFLPASATASATLIAREPGVFSGAEVFEVAMTSSSSTDVKVELCARGRRAVRGRRRARPRRGLGPRGAAGRAGRAQPRAADVRHRDADRSLRRGGRRHRGSGRRHPQDHAGAAGAGDVSRARAAAATTTASRSRMPCWPRTTTSPCSSASSAVDLGTAIRDARARIPHTHPPRGRGRPARPDRAGARRRRRTRSCSTTSPSTNCVEGVRAASPAGRWSRPAAASPSTRSRGVAATGVDVICVGALTHSVARPGPRARRRRR